MQENGCLQQRDAAVHRRSGGNGQVVSRLQLKEGSSPSEQRCSVPQGVRMKLPAPRTSQAKREQELPSPAMSYPRSPSLLDFVGGKGTNAGSPVTVLKSICRQPPDFQVAPKQLASLLAGLLRFVCFFLHRNPDLSW